MKKLLCLSLICLLSGMIYAFPGNGKKANGALDNSSIKKSEKEQDKQTKKFQNQRRYSGQVNSHSPRQRKRNAAKAQQTQQKEQGKGL